MTLKGHMPMPEQVRARSDPQWGLLGLYYLRPLPCMLNQILIWGILWLGRHFMVFVKLFVTLSFELFLSCSREHCSVGRAGAIRVCQCHGVCVLFARVFVRKVCARDFLMNAWIQDLLAEDCTVTR